MGMYDPLMTTICGHIQPDTTTFSGDHICHCGDMPCQLPVGHAYGHWYAPRVTQELADLINER